MTEGTPRPPGTLYEGERVKLHVNLHRGDFAVTAEGESTITAYVTDALLVDVTFHVDRQGLQRAVSEGQRNVHAWAEGRLVRVNTGRVGRGRPVTYNPFKHATFVDARGGAVRKASRVLFQGRQGWVLG